ncbi:hypothetical protein FOCG_04162 [Fusarium oxysporum f. sp. radicis-lycopersici 26381]|uniref:Uncharacterized protein n=1 Tax=Fusarium oxysporum Fo47 TaxID=660027 RepID=W9JYD3_FUSOX|nr:hypothetical protein FOZG_10978 [Fusarium oxysporum Fo47]EWZ90184.1 hypothetical protein FOWG_07927 [Fusarium oxysporum f. sp. lycopersici MN25]EXL56617.1 hypothetical protein FOCG_04162 [Fusarium oxysporum f. sp. radicis-lycopersici 26381]
MKSDGLGRTRCNQPAFRRLGNGHDPCSHVGGCVSWEDFLALSTECSVRIMKMEAFGRFIKHHFMTCQVVDPQPRSTPMDLEDCGSKKPQQRFKPHQRNRRHMPEDFSCMRDAK